MADSTAPLLDKEEVHHIALWMPNWIGDVVFVLPTLQSLRRRYPNARITAIARAPSDELLSSCRDLDTIIQFPRNKGDGYIKQFNYAYGLRKYRFDLGIVFPNSIHSAMMLMFTGARFRIGYSICGRRIFLTHALPVTKKEKKTSYRVDYFHKITSPLNLGLVPDHYDPKWKRKSKVKLENSLLKVGVDKTDFLVIVHPGTSKPERAWHAERFGILCQKLIKEYRMKIILLGARKESQMLEKIRELCSAGMTTIACDLNLQEIVQLLEGSRLFIGNDSGMMHLASLVGTPVVGIFGPGHSGTTGPFLVAEKQEIVTQNYPCSPCRQRFFKECKPSHHHKPYCLEDISVKCVAGAVDRIVKRLELS